MKRVVIVCTLMLVGVYLASFARVEAQDKGKDKGKAGKKTTYHWTVNKRVKGLPKKVGEKHLGYHKSHPVSAEHNAKGLVTGVKVRKNKHTKVYRIPKLPKGVQRLPSAKAGNDRHKPSGGVLVNHEDVYPISFGPATARSLRPARAFDDAGEAYIGFDSTAPGTADPVIVWMPVSAVDPTVASMAIAPPPALSPS